MDVQVKRSGKTLILLKPKFAVGMANRVDKAKLCNFDYCAVFVVNCLLLTKK